MTTRIIGTGSSLPETAATNDYLSTIMDTSDEWITSRTGIRERRLAKTETTASMATEAAQKALKDAGVTPEEIELIVVGTITPDHKTPSTACEVQAALGAVNAVGFDVSAACTGFMVAFHTAHAFMQLGVYKKALVIGAETLSKIMDWNDRKTCVLFGDGAGAAVLSTEDIGLISFIQGSDGSRGMALTCQDRINNNPLVQNSKELLYTHMNGQEVYKFAVTRVPICINQVLEQADLNLEDIKYFILHQANIRIIQSVAKRLKVSEDRFPMNLQRCANTSAASVPIMLDEVNRQGLLQRGDKIVLVGFGGGLSWGADVVEW